MKYRLSQDIYLQCFQIVVLGNTLETALDSKIKPVNPKGNQLWTFIGKTDAEAEVPILWPPDTKSQLIGIGPGIDRRGISRGPRATRLGTGLSWGHQSVSLRSPSWVESTCRNSRKSRRFSPPREMRPISAEAYRGKLACNLEKELFTCRSHPAGSFLSRVTTSPCLAAFCQSPEPSYCSGF